MIPTPKVGDEVRFRITGSKVISSKIHIIKSIQTLRGRTAMTVQSSWTQVVIFEDEIFALWPKR